MKYWTLKLHCDWNVTFHKIEMFLMFAKSNSTPRGTELQRLLSKRIYYSYCLADSAAEMTVTSLLTMLLIYLNEFFVL
jgi:hypothetical protein